MALTTRSTRTIQLTMRKDLDASIDQGRAILDYQTNKITLEGPWPADLKKQVETIGIGPSFRRRTLADGDRFMDALLQEFWGTYFRAAEIT